MFQLCNPQSERVPLSPTATRSSTCSSAPAGTGAWSRREERSSLPEAQRDSETVVCRDYSGFFRARHEQREFSRDYMRPLTSILHRARTGAAPPHIPLAPHTPCREPRKMAKWLKSVLFGRQLSHGSGTEDPQSFDEAFQTLQQAEVKSGISGIFFIS